MNYLNTTRTTRQINLSKQCAAVDIDLSDLKRRKKYAEFAVAEKWKYAREAVREAPNWPSWINVFTKQSIKYHFQDEAFKNSCYKYDVMLGFVEFNEDYCDNTTDLKRTFDISVKSGWETVRYRDVNVAALADRCCKAHMVSITITPESKDIDLEITKGAGSHGLPILSLIQIQPSTLRRLTARCNKEAEAAKLTDE
jgi:hypothetical protein